MPLHLAVMKNLIEMFNTLLSKGANIHATTINFRNLITDFSIKIICKR